MAEGLVRCPSRRWPNGLAALALLLMGGCDPARENQEKIAEENRSGRFLPVDATCSVTVDFQRNSDRLDGRARRMIRFAARRALNDMSRKITVVGLSADGELDRLDRRRSRAVADQLKKDGVPPSMIVAYTMADLPPSSPAAIIDTCSGIHD
jgi:outer membrane protein OmpA-like peptidoglycan-associated protein